MKLYLLGLNFSRSCRVSRGEAIQLGMYCVVASAWRIHEESEQVENRFIQQLFITGWPSLSLSFLTAKVRRFLDVCWGKGGGGLATQHSRNKVKEISSSR